MSKYSSRIFSGHSTFPNIVWGLKVKITNQNKKGVCATDNLLWYVLVKHISHASIWKLPLMQKVLF